MKDLLLNKIQGRTLFHESQKDEQIRLIISRIKKEQIHGAVYESLSGYCNLEGFKALLFNDNVNQLKQWFYVSSLLLAESCKYSGGWNMWTSHPFIFPLLTDNNELIKRYSLLTTINDQDNHKSLSEVINYPKEGRFGVLRLQAVLSHDWDKVDEMKEIFFSQVKKPKNFEIWEIEFYDAIKNKDVGKTENVIYEYLNLPIHKYLNQHLVEEFSGEIWSHHSVMFTKLAWMNGLEIEIDHPLVPMELMPIKPLEHYDYYYDFLDPNWKPRSFFGKLFNRK